MDEPRTSRITPPQPEVKGHIISRKGATPETDQEAEVGGHIKRFTRATDQPRPGDDPEADVEGHAARKMAIEQLQGDGAEVEGHLNPVLAQDMASAHQRTLHAQADRDRRARTAVDGTDRDAGMLAKIKKFAGRED